MSWTSTTSGSFTARHRARDSADAHAVLSQLEESRQRLSKLFPALPESVSVVLHPSESHLLFAQPQQLIVRQLTTATARRYQTGCFTGSELHVLSPEALRHRAAGDESGQALALAPSRELSRLTIGYNNPYLPPPFRPKQIANLYRWAWLIDGGGQHLSGQVQYLGSAVRLFMRFGGKPKLPPGRRNSVLIAGSIFDLLEKQRGASACAMLCCSPLEKPSLALEQAFEMPLSDIEARWQTHVHELYGL